MMFFNTTNHTINLSKIIYIDHNARKVFMSDVIWITLDQTVFDKLIAAIKRLPNIGE